jgi:chromosome segregation ATPase
MSKIYESLEGLMQKTLQRNKAGKAIARVKGSTASSLDDEMEKLQKLVVDTLGGLKAAVKAGEAVVAGETKHAEQLIESLRVNVAVLEAKVKQTEDTVRRNEAASQSMEKSLTDKIALLEAQLRDAEKIAQEKAAAIPALQQNSAAKVQDLESQLRDKERILASRDAQINDLTSQLQTLNHGIKEMSSFFRQAEALAAVEAKDKNAAAPGGTTGPAVAAKATDTAQETMAPSFFDSLIRELTQVLGPMASVVVRDRVASLGESMEKFPKDRVPELLETISQEILDDNGKATFRERLAVNL